MIYINTCMLCIGIGFSCLVTGVTTDSIKNAVGRPRPNFFHRCFPDGKAVLNISTNPLLLNLDIKDNLLQPIQEAQLVS